MAYSGAGVFNRIHSWLADRDNGVRITASRHDAEDDGFATGLSNAICRDGQSTITAPIPFNAQKITGLGVAASDADAMSRITSDTRYLKGGDLDGTLTTSIGSTNEYRATLTNPAVTALVDGIMFGFTAAATNTGAATMTVTTAGAVALTQKALRRQVGSADAALAANDIYSGYYYLVRYDTAGNGAVGAWVVLNPTQPSAGTVTGALTVTGAATVTGAVTASATLAVGTDGAVISKLLSGTRTNDFGNIGAGVTATTTCSVTGAVSGSTNAVFVGSNAATTEGIVYQAYVSASDVVTITATNITTGTVNPGNQTFRVLVLDAV